jgi:hypothetical protein
MKTTHKPAEPGESSAKARDLDHYDVLTVIRDRCLGLRCAISGAGVAEAEDLSGLQQLVADLIESFNELCSAFAEERGLQARKR